MSSVKLMIGNTFNGIFGPVPNPSKWVFIVGCYNSGTTLLHDLLASHPQVGSMPREGQVYTDELVPPKSVGLPRLWAIEPEQFYLDEKSLTNINVTRLKRQWGARFNDHTKPILMEKSPTNAARVRWFQKYFDDSYFIGIVRNGYAVAEGIRRKAGHSLQLAARQWLVSNEIMLRDFELLQRKRIITYEELTEDPAESLEAIYSFLSLDASHSQDAADRVWRIHEQVSTIKNMNERSLAVLTADEINIIEEVAGPMLREFGYYIST